MPVGSSFDEDYYNRTWNDSLSTDDPSSKTPWQWDDAAWILAASFVIFSMQTGYLLLPTDS